MTTTDLDRAATLLVLGAAALLLLRPLAALLLVGVGALPGAGGAAARRAGWRLAPVLLRRAVLGGLAAGALPALLPAAAVAAPAAGPVAGLPDLDRGPLPGTRPPRPAVPAVPAVPVRHYRVREGDCLWRIAAAHLPPGAADAAVDRAWRRWYRLNRDVVGPDPDVVVPGQLLRVPGGAA